MQSLEYQHTRKHQTNSSSSKATYAFTKDNRFKKENYALYILIHIDATPSTIYHPKWEEHPPQASAEALNQKYSMPTSIPPHHKITTSSPVSSSARKVHNSVSVDKYLSIHKENKVQWHIQ